MKVVVETKDVEGLDGLLGQVVTFFCMNYIYTGKLVGVNSDCIKIEDPKIVYETGAWTESGWKDAQPLPTKYFYIQKSSLESYGICKQ